MRYMTQKRDQDILSSYHYTVIKLVQQFTIPLTYTEKAEPVTWELPPHPAQSALHSCFHVALVKPDLLLHALDSTAEHIFLHFYPLYYYSLFICSFISSLPKYNSNSPSLKKHKSHIYIYTHTHTIHLWPGISHPLSGILICTLSVARPRNTSQAN